MDEQESIALAQVKLEYRVDAGVAWFDKHVPDWWVHIDLAKLSLGNKEFCICGHLRTALCGTWRSFSDELGHDPLGFGWSFPPELGLDGTEFEYRLLDELWVDAIKKRWAGDA